MNRTKYAVKTRNILCLYFGIVTLLLLVVIVSLNSLHNHIYSQIRCMNVWCFAEMCLATSCALRLQHKIAENYKPNWLQNLCIDGIPAFVYVMRYIESIIDTKNYHSIFDINVRTQSELKMILKRCTSHEKTKKSIMWWPIKFREIHVKP